ncbi:MAG TPA: GNAT family N-acetyltransferase, partial [Acidimicrobiales bacterium]|nr:GNAT family N-acetyltransferase [Acidimicrobiales bacterium]
METDLDGPLPGEEEVLDRLHRHLRRWLGAWPPTSMVAVVGCDCRTAPGWDGVVRPFAGVETPEGTILSVPPETVEAVRAAGATLEEILDGVPEAIGQPGAVVGKGVYRYALAPADIEPIGEWVPAEAPDVPAWLRPFGGEVLVVRDEGKYVAGLGIKRHDRLGMEVAVATDEAWRGRGLARALVARGAAAI